MRTTFLAVALIAAAGFAQAQNPSATLPSQGSSLSPSLSPTTPSAGTDEVAARRKLEDAGYKDLRSMTPNPDGTLSTRATRNDNLGVRSGPSPEVNVDIDASGNIKER